jgi:hypothetical protein
MKYSLKPNKRSLFDASNLKDGDKTYMSYLSSEDILNWKRKDVLNWKRKNKVR